MFPSQVVANGWRFNGVLRNTGHRYGCRCDGRQPCCFKGQCVGQLIYWLIFFQRFWIPATLRLIPVYPSIALHTCSFNQGSLAVAQWPFFSSPLTTPTLSA